MRADAQHLGITEAVPETLTKFHDRPFQVIDAERFVEAIEPAITSDVVRRWPPRVGSISQWADATDVQDRPAVLARLRALTNQSRSRNREGAGVSESDLRY